MAFAVGERMFVKRRFGQIPMDGRKLRQSEFVGAMSAVAHTCFLHGRPPRESFDFEFEPPRWRPGMSAPIIHRIGGRHLYSTAPPRSIGRKGIRDRAGRIA